MSGTVFVGIVATECHGSLVGSDDAVVPSYSCGRGAVSKVLLNKFGLASKPKNVVSGMLGKLNGLTKGIFELSLQCDVT